MNYGEYLKAARVRAGLSAEEVARALELKGADMVFRYERGASDPPLSTVAKIAEMCEMQLGDLFPSETPRAHGIDRLLIALQDLEEDERADMVEDMVRMVRRTSLIAKRREVRRDIALTSQRDVSPVSVTGVTKVTEPNLPLAHAAPSSAIPGVQRTAVSVLEVGPEIGGTRDAQQQQQRRKHGNKKAENNDNHGDTK